MIGGDLEEVCQVGLSGDVPAAGGSWWAEHGRGQARHLQDVHQLVGPIQQHVVDLLVPGALLKGQRSEVKVWSSKVKGNDVNRISIRLLTLSTKVNRDVGVVLLIR